MSSTPSPKDWLILQCQACGSPMKVRAEAVAGQRVACPVCRSPMAVHVPGSGQSPEFRAPMARDADRVANESVRRRALEDQTRDEEFVPTLGNRPPEAPAPMPASLAPDGTFLHNLKSTGDYESGRRVKVKKRRKKAAPNHNDLLADWDTVLESLPEAELYSDPWTESVPIPEEVIKEKSRDFVVSEEDEDGGTVRRVKRVRKRRLFSWAQLFFRRLSLGMRIVTVTAVAAIGLGGIAAAIIIFREKFKPVTYEDVVADEKPGQFALTKQDESNALDAVKGFLDAKGLDAKLKWVRLPSRVRPLMEKYYSRVEDKPIRIKEVAKRDKILTQGAYFVLLEAETAEPGAEFGSVRHFAVEEKEDADGNRTYLLDWETAVEYREMSFEEFKAQRPRGNVSFRVKLSADSYYNHGFSDEKKWFAAAIYFPRPGHFAGDILFHGYMDRTSEVFKKLSPIIASGRNPAVIVNLRYPDDSLSPEQVVIDSLVHDSWFFVKDTPAGEKGTPAGEKDPQPRTP